MENILGSFPDEILQIGNYFALLLSAKDGKKVNQRIEKWIVLQPERSVRIAKELINKNRSDIFQYFQSRVNQDPDEQRNETDLQWAAQFIANILSRNERVSLRSRIDLDVPNDQIELVWFLGRENTVTISDLQKLLISSIKASSLEDIRDFRRVLQPETKSQVRGGIDDPLGFDVIPDDLDEIPDTFKQTSTIISPFKYYRILSKLIVDIGIDPTTAKNIMEQTLIMDSNQRKQVVELALTNPDTSGKQNFTISPDNIILKNTFTLTEDVDLPSNNFNLPSHTTHVYNFSIPNRFNVKNTNPNEDGFNLHGINLLEKTGLTINNIIDYITQRSKDITNTFSSEIYSPKWNVYGIGNQRNRFTTILPTLNFSPRSVETFDYEENKDWPKILIRQRGKRYSYLFYLEFNKWYSRIFRSVFEKFSKYGWTKENGFISDVMQNALHVLSRFILGPLLKETDEYFLQVKHYDFPVTVEELKSYLFEILDGIHVNSIYTLSEEQRERSALLVELLEEYRDSEFKNWFKEWKNGKFEENSNQSKFFDEVENWVNSLSDTSNSKIGKRVTISTKLYTNAFTDFLDNTYNLYTDEIVRIFDGLPPRTNLFGSKDTFEIFWIFIEGESQKWNKEGLIKFFNQSDHWLYDLYLRNVLNIDEEKFNMDIYELSILMLLFGNKNLPKSTIRIPILKERIGEGQILSENIAQNIDKFYLPQFNDYILWSDKEFFKVNRRLNSASKYLSSFRSLLRKIDLTFLIKDDISHLIEKTEMESPKTFVTIEVNSLTSKSYEINPWVIKPDQSSISTIIFSLFKDDEMIDKKAISSTIGLKIVTTQFSIRLKDSASGNYYINVIGYNSTGNKIIEGSSHFLTLKVITKCVRCNQLYSEFENKFRGCNWEWSLDFFSRSTEFLTRNSIGKEYFEASFILKKTSQNLSNIPLEDKIEIKKSVKSSLKIGFGIKNEDQVSFFNNEIDTLFQNSYDVEKTSYYIQLVFVYIMLSNTAVTERDLRFVSTDRLNNVNLEEIEPTSKLIGFKVEDPSYSAAFDTIIECITSTLALLRAIQTDFIREKLSRFYSNFFKKTPLEISKWFFLKTPKQIEKLRKDVLYLKRSEKNIDFKSLLDSFKEEFKSTFIGYKTKTDRSEIIHENVLSPLVGHYDRSQPSQSIHIDNIVKPSIQTKFIGLHSSNSTYPDQMKVLENGPIGEPIKINVSSIRLFGLNKQRHSHQDLIDFIEKSIRKYNSENSWDNDKIKKINRLILKSNEILFSKV